MLAERVGDHVAEPLVLAEQVDERGAETGESQLSGLGHVRLGAGLVAPEPSATAIITSMGHDFYDSCRPKL
jgi:hypothetical protein